MKHSPVLKNVYTRVDILSLDQPTSTFSKIASIYMLGGANKYVKSISDLSIKNKALSAEIGVDVIKALTRDRQISGGDGEWDELDELDIDELLNMNVEPVVTSAKNTRSDFTGDHFSDFALYTKDKISDVRDKVAIISGIEPYKQYLWAVDAHRSLDGGEISLMSHWATSMRSIDGYPIDAHQSDTDSVEHTMEVFANNSVLVLTCISLDSVIGNKSKLHMIARSDAESFGMIYDNTINRFFPMVSLPAFTQYLTDEKLIFESFPSLAFDSKELQRQYIQLDALLPTLNKEKPILITSSDMLTVATTGLVLYKSYCSVQMRSNTMQLFQMLDITTMSNVSKIDLYRYNGGRMPIRIRKIHQLDNFQGNKDDLVYAEGIQSRLNLIKSRAILITLLPRKEYDSLSIIIDQYGSIWVKAKPNQTFSYSKAAFISILAPVIDPIIQAINDCEGAFASHERYPLVGDSASEYLIPSSSSKITFKKSISYQKLLDIIAAKLIPAGLVEPFVNDWTKRQKLISYYATKYGITRSSDTNERRKMIEVKDIGGSAIISLTNLDIEESNLYIDLIGRLVLGSGSELDISKGSRRLAIADPILFRPSGSSDIYSRICQKRFQPVLTTKDDSKAVEYKNFTFDRPEYYKCPSRAAPNLGFLQGKHDKGYCLPCCRKGTQSDAIIESCLDDDSSSVDKGLLRNTYKIDYPISDVANIKVMNRRITMPKYIGQLFGLDGLVANGSIMFSHVEIRDGSNPSIKSFLQTAVMISAIRQESGLPTYKSYRVFMLDLIAAIKQPSIQSSIMSHSSVSQRYTTIQELIHSIEDQFIKMTVLETSEAMSDMEWNDLIIFMANCMGLNILLLADDRASNNSIQMLNINDIDISRPVVVFLRRINLEWSVMNHNTRAVYLPVTSSIFRVMAKSPLVIERLDISSALSKIKRVVRGPLSKMISKRFTVDQILHTTSGSKQYRLIEDMTDQKIAVIGIGRSVLISTVSTSSTTIHPKPTNIAPTASFSSMLHFITDYNQYFVDELVATNGKQTLESYSTYLQAALKSSNRYEFIGLNAFLLKIKQCIIHNNLVIGVVVNLFEINKVVATELMFIKPTPKKTIQTELSGCIKELNALHSRVNSKSIICYPLTAANPTDKASPIDVSFVSWDMHPLQAATDESKVCARDMMDSFNRGTYTSEVYSIFARDIIDMWAETRPTDLINFISKRLKKINPPYLNTTIDVIIKDSEKEFGHYDPTIVRASVNHIADQINSFDKTSSMALSRIAAHSEFNRFELKNIHRLTRTEIKRNVESLVKELCVKTSAYPSFDIDIPIAEQRDLFYRPKDNKLMIHCSLYADLIDMLVSDLCSPFRRGYIIDARLVEFAVSDIRPHKGEIIYVHRVES
jgi:hypothetical protein